MRSSSLAWDLAELVRLPAALTVPGDAWAGASRSATGSEASLMPVGSVLLYWSGMALNDWADRGVDAVERPERVIPSGRLRPDRVLLVAGLLGACGVAVTAAVGGPAALRVSVPLAALVATYDVVAKDSAAGPFVMASTRGLDVLLGATAAPGAALAPAVSVALHTLGVTVLSRGEVHGADRASTVAAMVATAAAGSVLLGSVLRGGTGSHRWLAVAGVACYGVAVGGPQRRAHGSPDAGTVRAATGSGIVGLTFLQAAWLAARGQTGRAALVASAGLVLPRAARRMSPT